MEGWKGGEGEVSGKKAKSSNPCSHKKPHL